MLPRYALGNWWSRYHPYTAEEYIALVDRFRAEEVPLSVAVIDMDWHLVDIDPKHGSGWTGYTWNTELFPDPKQFLADLHERGLATSLNVHPAEGVHAHETAYAAIAERMGVDPHSELPVSFDPTDPDFIEAYFEELHHPLEGEGVDFWWLDWQQGGVTKIPDLDPLWLLNHFHFLDSGRGPSGDRRPLTFSRYAGIGSHRYPIGFSGDTVISWESLDFQPYFTATASNAGYGWWSHDIGGHFKGYRDDELATRWVQLGVFSPVNRLHSGLNPFNTKEPWRFPPAAEHVMTDFLRLRHQLLPYLSTMNLRAHTDGEPLVQPMYYDHPDDLSAYDVPNQFMFGSELLVAPITTPADPATGLGRVKAWLPEGTWTDVFTGLTYTGGRTIYLHRDLSSIPVLAKAGAIVPMVPADEPAGRAPRSPRSSRCGSTPAPTASSRSPRTPTTTSGPSPASPTTTRPARSPCTPPRATPATLPDDRTYRVEVVTPTGTPDERVFALLDRAQIPFELKASAYDAVRADPGRRVRGARAAEPRPVTHAARCDQRDPARPLKRGYRSGRETGRVEHVVPERQEVLTALPGPAQVVLGTRRAVVPELPAPGRRLGRGEPHHRVRAGLGVAQQRTHHLVEAGQRREHTRGVRPARVHGVHGDPVSGPALLHERGQRDLHALRAGVGGRAAVGRVEVLRVVGGELLGVHPARGHQHHPCAARGREDRTQQLGQQQRAEDVGGQRDLVAVAATPGARAASPRRCARARRPARRTRPGRPRTRAPSRGPRRRSGAAGAQPRARRHGSRSPRRGPSPGRARPGGPSRRAGPSTRPSPSRARSSRR